MPKRVVTVRGERSSNNVIRDIESRGCKVIGSVSTVMNDKGTIYYSITYECADENQANSIEQNAHHIRGGTTKKNSK
uniref:Uncharacterized protein n=1 Tax=viral metagenome TaxID=1070528 RepID=A0A6C0I4G5_9ZZZZ